jgi:hypothetical protein
MTLGPEFGSPGYAVQRNCARADFCWLVSGSFCYLEGCWFEGGKMRSRRSEQSGNRRLCFETKRSLFEPVCVLARKATVRQVKRVKPGRSVRRCPNIGQQSRCAEIDSRIPYQKVAGSTGLEPATSGVTGQRSNQLNYDPAATRKMRVKSKVGSKKLKTSFLTLRTSNFSDLTSNF